MNNDILVLVDCQEDFFRGTLGNQNTLNITPKLVELTKYHIDTGSIICCTYDYHYAANYLNSREGRYLPITHCTDSKNAALITELDDILYNYDKKMDLVKIDSFGFPNLYDKIVNARNFDWYLDTDYNYSIHVAGVVTNMCVLSVALDFQHLFTRSEIIIHSDACASHDMELHNKTLDVMRGLQMQVR